MPRFDERPLRGIAELIPAAVLSGEATVETAYLAANKMDLEERAPWLVVVSNDNQPIKVMQTSSLEQLMRGLYSRERIRDAARGPDFLIADIATTFRSVLDQVESLSLEDPTFVVVTNSPGETIGVTTVERLRRDLFHRRLASATLPGRPKIPPLVRSCKYHESRWDCPHTLQFQTRPPVMPLCANPLRLNSHTFVW